MAAQIQNMADKPYQKALIVANVQISPHSQTTSILTLTYQIASLVPNSI
jgi:hypothetical protein